MIVCTPEQPELTEALESEAMSTVAIGLLMVLPFTARRVELAVRSVP